MKLDYTMRIKILLLCLFTISIHSVISRRMKSRQIVRDLFDITKADTKPRKTGKNFHIKELDFSGLDKYDLYQWNHKNHIKYTSYSDVEAIKEIAHKKYLHPEIFKSLIKEVTNLYKNEKTIVSVNVPKTADITFIGDLQGSLEDLLFIISKKGLPSSKNYYLFTGDYVDTGYYGIEVLSTILLLKKNFKDYVFLTRGHHEDTKINQKSNGDGPTLIQQGERIYSEDTFKNLYKEITNFYKALPLGYIVNKKIFAVHGGITRNYAKQTLDDMSKENRYAEYIKYSPYDNPTTNFADFLWSDPYEYAKDDEKDFEENTHSGEYGILFNEKATIDFLKKNGLDLIIRGHSQYECGYDVQFHKKVVTVFSSSRYHGESHDLGAIATISGKNLRKKKINADDLDFKVYDSIRPSADFHSIC